MQRLRRGDGSNKRGFVASYRLLKRLDRPQNPPFGVGRILASGSPLLRDRSKHLRFQLLDFAARHVRLASAAASAGCRASLASASKIKATSASCGRRAPIAP